MFNNLERIIADNKAIIQQKDSDIAQLDKKVQVQAAYITEMEMKIQDYIQQLTSLQNKNQQLETDVQIKNQLAQQLKEEILKRGGDHNIIQELNYQKDQNQKYAQALQLINIKYENAEFQINQLNQEILRRSQPEIIYLKNDTNDLLEKYQDYVKQQNALKEELHNQILLRNKQIDQLQISIQQLNQKFSNQQRNHKQELENLHQKLMESTNLSHEYKQQLEQLKQKSLEYEKGRLEYEQQSQSIIISKDDLIRQQSKQIEQLQLKVNQSSTFVSDTIDRLLPKEVDQYIEQYKEMFQVKKENEKLVNQNQQLKQQLRTLENDLKKELPTIQQRKLDFEQLKRASVVLKEKLEAEIKENMNQKKRVNDSESLINGLKLEIELKKNEINKIKEENTTFHQLVDQLRKYLPNDIDQSYYQVQFYKAQGQDIIEQLNAERLELQQEIFQLKQMKNYEIQVSASAQELNDLQREIKDLQQILLQKEEYIVKQMEEINLLNKELEIKKLSQSNIQPIVHKIEKIYVQSKNKQMAKKPKNYSVQIRKLENELRISQFEEQKLKQYCQFEKLQREFIEENMGKLQRELDRLRVQMQEQEKEFLIKLKQIETENKQKLNSRIDYYPQNRALTEQLNEKVKIIEQQYYQIDKLQNELKNQKQHIEMDTEINQELLEYKIKIENQNIILRTYEEQLSQLRTQKLYIIEQENVCEEFQKFFKQIQQRQDESKKFESGQELRETLEMIQKKLYEDYDQKLTQIKEEYSRMQLNKDNIIKQFQDEQEKIIEQLNEFKQLYQDELADKKDQTAKLTEELQELKIQLEQTLKEKNDYQLKVQNYELEFNINNQKQEQKVWQYSCDQKLLDQQKIEIQQLQSKLQLEHQELKNMELALATNTHVLMLQIEELQNKLLFEQKKVKQFGVQEIEVQEDLSLKNQINQQLYEIEQNKVALLSKQFNAPEAQQDYEEEKRHYIRQIEQLQQLRDNITVSDVQLVKDLVQDGRLLIYLEKAKELYMSQQI